jgi:hypothetical protein
LQCPAAARPIELAPRPSQLGYYAVEGAAAGTKIARAPRFVAVTANA